MKKIMIVVLYVFSLASSFANASITSSFEDFSCSGSTFSESPDTTISCSGDLRLVGGSIVSTDVLRILADGSLYIDDMLLSAVNGIVLSANTIYLGENTVFLIDGHELPPPSREPVTILMPPPSGGLITGGSITPVPEPETYAMMLAGLGLMGFVTTRRRPFSNQK